MTPEEYYSIVFPSIAMPAQDSAARPSDILGDTWARLTDIDRARAAQIESEIQGLEELKRLNTIYPTQKRTRAIRELEKRYMDAGILR